MTSSIVSAAPSFKLEKSGFYEAQYTYGAGAVWDVMMLGRLVGVVACTGPKSWVAWLAVDHQYPTVGTPPRAEPFASKAAAVQNLVSLATAAAATTASTATAEQPSAVVTAPPPTTLVLSYDLSGVESADNGDTAYFGGTYRFLDEEYPALGNDRTNSYRDDLYERIVSAVETRWPGETLGSGEGDDYDAMMELVDEGPEDRAMELIITRNRANDFSFALHELLEPGAMRDYRAQKVEKLYIEGKWCVAVFTLGRPDEALVLSDDGKRVVHVRHVPFGRGTRWESGAAEPRGPVATRLVALLVAARDVL